jgi:hypothetical protein
MKFLTDNAGRWFDFGRQAFLDAGIALEMNAKIGFFGPVNKTL